MQDESEIKFFIDIFIHLSENNMNLILTQKNFEILSIILDLTKICPLSSKLIYFYFSYELIYCLIYRDEFNL